MGSLLVTKDVGIVYSSDLRRARTTAEIIAERLERPLVTDGRLRERNFGKLEGSPTSAPTAEITGILRGRVADIDARPPGGESIGDLAARCQDFIDWLLAQPRDGDVVVVAHGGSIRLLQAALTGAPPAGLAWGPVGIASVHRVQLPAPAPGGRVQPGPQVPHWARAPSPR